MRQKPTVAEKLSSFEVALVPTDTLLRALGMMDRYRLPLLPVVGETGLLVGLLSRAHVMSAWGVDPLLPVSLVMAACERSSRPALYPVPR